MHLIASSSLWQRQTGLSSPMTVIPLRAQLPAPGQTIFEMHYTQERNNWWPQVKAFILSRPKTSLQKKNEKPETHKSFLQNPQKST